MPSSSDFRAVIFDIDGVLLHLTATETQTFVGAFARSFQITGIDQDWNNYKKRNDVEIAKEILARHFGRPATAAELAQLCDDYLADLEAGLEDGRIVPEVLPGVRETLEALTGQSPDLCLALATANLSTAAELRLGRADLWQPFHCGGYAEDGEDKTAILSAVIAKCGRWAGRPIAPHEVLFLGDQPSDARAAVTNGTGFIGIAAEPAQRRRLEAAGAVTVIGSLTAESIVSRLR